MKKKEDLRVIKSKQAIKEAFINLVEIKGYRRVSVCEIASKAMINRNTFYLHYEDKDDLVKQILNDTFQKFSNKLLQYDPASINRINETQLRLSIRYLLLLLEPDIELYRIIILDDDLNGFFNTISNSIKEILIEKLKVENPRTDNAFEYAFSGMLGVIKQWIVYSSTNIHTIAKLLAKMTYNNLKYYNYHE